MLPSLLKSPSDTTKLPATPDGKNRGTLKVGDEHAVNARISVVVLAVLLATTGSGVPLATVMLELAKSETPGETTTTIDADPPPTIDPSVQFTVVDTVQLPCDGVADTSVAPRGSDCVVVTPA